MKLFNYVFITNVLPEKLKKYIFFFSKNHLKPDKYNKRETEWNPNNLRVWTKKSKEKHSI